MQFQKNPYPPHGRYWKFRGCGIGRGSNQKNFCGGVWIFSRTTTQHYSVDGVRINCHHILYSPTFNFPQLHHHSQNLDQSGNMMPPSSSSPPPPATTQYYSLPYPYQENATFFQSPIAIFKLSNGTNRAPLQKILSMGVGEWGYSVVHILWKLYS